MSKDPYTPDYKERLSPETIFFLQLQKCLTLQSIDDTSPQFQSSVNGLLSVSPKNIREKIYGREGEYNYETVQYVPKLNCGIPMGSETNPKTKKDKYNKLLPIPKLENGSIDWDSPIIISPKREIVTGVDFNNLLLIICEEAENFGMTWEQDTETNIMIGTYDELMKPYDKEAHPLLKEDLEDDSYQEDTEPEL